MKLYLDTNVYSFIASRDEARRVRSFLDEQQHVALVSCNHLAETWRIEDQERRVREMRCLTAVASPTSYSGLPESYIQAQEVLAEMRRLRPGWLALVPDDTSRISVFLNFHRRDWSAVRRDPSYVPPGQSLVKASVESAMPRNREAHRELRDLILRLRKLNLEPGLRLHSEFSDTWDKYDSPEVFWRVEAASAWTRAIIERHPASRDYVDWVGPYLRRGRMDGLDWFRFWLTDIDEGRVPRNRLLGLVTYYQAYLPKQKWGHGNAIDAQHAHSLLDSDVFLTADQAFHGVLLALREHFPGAAQVRLIDSSSSSALAEIEAALASVT